MKKNFYFIATMFFALMSVMTMTSCEDEEIARTLEGTWEGNMYVEHEWSGQWYETDYSEVTFLRDPYRYSSGEGYWVDYFRGYTPWGHRYYANHIKWNVNNGVINIYFIEDDVDLRIRDYRLNDNYFSGQVYGSDGRWYDFSLRHLSRPYRYDDYYWGYDEYYYAKSANNLLNDNDSVITRSNSTPVPASHNRRVMKK